MSIQHWHLGVVVVLLLVIAAIGVNATLRGAPPEMSMPAWQGKTSEAILRSRVLTEMRPQCPQLAAQPSPAAVVTQVYVAPSGRVLDVEVLESPSAAASEVVEEAVRAWTFRKAEPISGREVVVAGKLTFYVTARGRGCVVLYPSELNRPVPSEAVLK